MNIFIIMKMAIRLNIVYRHITTFYTSEQHNYEYVK